VALVGQGPSAGVERLVPERVDRDPRLMARAAGPGRIRAAVVDTWAEVLADPAFAGRTIGRRLREAKHLHSAERRLVADALYGLVRHHRWLEQVAGRADAQGLWEAWLTTQSGPPPQVTVPDDPVEALVRFGSIDAAFAAALLASGIDAVAFLAASNARAPLVLRADARIGREPVAARLREEGVATVAGVAPDALRVEGGVDVHALASFREGWFEVQDEGSQAVGALAFAPGGFVVDLCAGAGGKSLQIAAAGARVLALDPRRSALEELGRRARRARLDIEVAQIGPSETLPAVAADVVLVDAPCTGSGTLRRSPELRFRIDAAHIAECVALQRQILDRAAGLVRPGGALVYATCSVLSVENDDVVASFLAAHPRFVVEEGLRLYPHRQGTDGFLAVRLRDGDTKG
jgi:16S rRNA (cytosine967-C5)-methyltransferase